MKDLQFPAKMVCTLREYLSYPAVGSSALKTLIDQSPAHYLYDRLNPSAPTPAQHLGTAIHQAILEPKKFHENAVVEPKFEGKGSVALKAKWHLENWGKLILKPDQHEDIKGILKALSCHREAFKYISAGAAEESLFWKDPETGVACKARPDYIRDGHILVDIKTTTDATYQSFQRDLAKYKYHVQGAMYLDGASQVFGRTFDQFIIIAVEKQAPYGIRCYLLDDSMIQEGRALYMKALRVLADCLKNEEFPGYPEALTPISLPTWAYQIEDANE